MSKELSERYYSGEAIPARDFTVSKEALEFFGDFVWTDFRNGIEHGQFSLEGELYHKRDFPVPRTLTPEEIHLRRNGSKWVK